MNAARQISDSSGRTTLEYTPGQSACAVAHGPQADPRWPAVAATLQSLREQGRRAVRIVDAECGEGSFVIEVCRLARSLGFTAIEGCGIDGRPDLIDRARLAGRRTSDPAIGFEFERADVLAALRREANIPADIVVWHGSRPNGRESETLAVLASAGYVIIGDPDMPAMKGRAA